MADSNNSMGYVELGGWVTNPEAQAWDGETSGLPPGDYVVEILDAERNTSSKGNPQVEVSFGVVEGEQEGRRAKAWYALTQKAVGRILNLLQACGLALDERGGFDVAALPGNRLIVKVIENTYSQGKNPVTGQDIVKTNSKVMGERALPPPPKAPPAKGAAGAKRG